MKTPREQAEELLATTTHNDIRLNYDLTQCQELLDLISTLCGELKIANYSANKWYSLYMTRKSDAEKERDELKVKLEAAEKELNRKQIIYDDAITHEGMAVKRADDLRKIKFTKFAGEECWIYREDGDNHLESLVCTVVIQPYLLLRMEEALAKYKEARE
mgnify:CR=1 FL=1